MSDKDIERAVAPFWRCPNCGSAGTPYVADLDALRAEVASLKAKNLDLVGGMTQLSADVAYYSDQEARLRAALEAAPTFHTNSREQDDFEFKYPHWYDTTRREALDG